MEHADDFSGYGISHDAEEIPEPQETPAGELSFRRDTDGFTLLVDGQDTGVLDSNIEVWEALSFGAERALLVGCDDWAGSAVIEPEKRVFLVVLRNGKPQRHALHEGPIHDLAERVADHAYGPCRIVQSALEVPVEDRGTLSYREGRLEYRLLPDYQTFLDRRKALQEEEAALDRHPLIRIDLDGGADLILTGRLERQPVPPGQPEIDQRTGCRSYVLILSAPVLLRSREQEAEARLTSYDFLGDPKTFEPLLGQLASVEAPLGFNGRGILLDSSGPHILAGAGLAAGTSGKP